MPEQGGLDIRTCAQCGLSGVGTTPRCDDCQPSPRKGRRKLPWRGVAIFLGGFVVGWVLGVGKWASTEQAVLETPALNTAFMSMISQEVAVRDARLFLANWAYSRDSTLYFEMMPPSAATPSVPWETLDRRGRQGVMEFFAIAYDRFLIHNGQSPMAGEGAYHPIGLKYLGLDTPLAVRKADGSIEIFRSPYASP